MSIRLKLLRHGSDELRRAEAICEQVTEFNAELRMAASEMIRVMCHEQGVGLAGPQVGLPLRLAVMNAGLDNGFHNAAHDMRMANPEIAEASPELVEEDEATLTLRGVAFRKARPKWVQARWSDVRTGEVKTNRLDGRAARIFCHLVEVLDGRFFPEEESSKR